MLIKNSYQTNNIRIFGIVVLVYFVFQIFFDFFEKINDYYHFGLPQFHRYMKLWFLIFLIFFLLVKIRTIEKILFLSSIGFLLIFISSWNFSFDQIEFFIQFSFFISALLSFSVYKFSKFEINLFYNIFKGFIVVNSIFILIGIIFNIEIFRTYSNRLGFNGLLISQMQSTVVYLSAICLALYKKDNLLFLLATASALLIGTKALMFGVPIFIGCIIIKRGVRIKYLIILVMFIIAIFIIFKQDIFINITEDHSFLTSFLSYRDQKFLTTIRTLEPIYGLKQFLIGGLDLALYRTELDLIDVFLFFGSVGLILLSLLIYNIWILSRHTLESTVYLFIICLVALLSGNILFYPFNSFLILLTLYSIKNDCTLKQNNGFIS